MKLTQNESVYTDLKAVGRNFAKLFNAIARFIQLILETYMQSHKFAS